MSERSQVSTCICFDQRLVLIQSRDQTTGGRRATYFNRRGGGHHLVCDAGAQSFPRNTPVRLLAGDRPDVASLWATRCQYTAIMQLFHVSSAFIPDIDLSKDGKSRRATPILLSQLCSTRIVAQLIFQRMPSQRICQRLQLRHSSVQSPLLGGVVGQHRRHHQAPLQPVHLVELNVDPVTFEQSNFLRRCICQGRS